MNKHATYQQLRGHLAYLKLTAAAEQLPAALEAAEKTKPGYTQFLHDLLDVEVEATRQRRLASRMRFAGFPSTKTLEEFDFTAQPTLDRRLVEELATLRFIEEKANVLLIGPPGVGKTKLAIALGAEGRSRRLPRLLHDRRRSRRPHQPGRDRRTLGDDDALLGRTAAASSSTYADTATMPNLSGRTSAKHVLIGGFLALAPAQISA